ncbi:MAG: hypothetical protein CVT98_02795 [Bacteroidetes bacterium HGW-Bacteroidetes-15]|nr:MAG: hypothetical protein CVT98_02795 [Bacteroidetes bacterium HGW-Bacteroidetes-15]
MGVLASVAQKAEVLYFKAELACCQAKACDAIEADVKAIIDNNFDDETVTFKEVKLAEASNKELVEIHKAKSQTVVIIAKKKKKETIVDVSDIVRNYSRSRNKAVFETELLAKINESIK